MLSNSQTQEVFRMLEELEEGWATNSVTHELLDIENTVYRMLKILYNTNISTGSTLLEDEWHTQEELPKKNKKFDLSFVKGRK